MCEEQYPKQVGFTRVHCCIFSIQTSQLLNAISELGMVAGLGRAPTEELRRFEGCPRQDARPLKKLGLNIGD